MARRVAVPMSERTPMNKTQAVLEHLRRHGSITSNEAWELYGATRLSAIVFNLRRRRHHIDTITCGGTDRYGHSMHYAKYVLLDDPEDDV